MLGANVDKVGWPACGEIDISEMAGGQGGTVGDRTTLSTTHWADASGNHASYGLSYNVGSTLGSAFRVYEVEWTPSQIVARVDGTQYYVIDTTPSALSEFRAPFYLLLNLAVGGTFFSPAITSAPAVTAAMPQSMQVDWVRVYEKSGTNLLANPGFETDVATQTPSRWGTWAPSSAEYAADYTETYGGARTGTYHLTHWASSTSYKAWTYQIVTGLASGKYTFRAWVRSSGTQNAAYLQAKNYNSAGSYITSNIPAASTWSLVTIPDIPVTNGQCEIGFYSDSPAGGWVHMDDAEFFLQ
jgi:hypothetical protein